MRISILNEASRNTPPSANDPLHPISSGLRPFVQLLIPFNSPHKEGTNYQCILLSNPTAHDQIYEPKYIIKT